MLGFADRRQVNAALVVGSQIDGKPCSKGPLGCGRARAHCLVKKRRLSFQKRLSSKCLESALRGGTAQLKTGWQAKVEAIASRLEAIALRLEAIASRLGSEVSATGPG